MYLTVVLSIILVLKYKERIIETYLVKWKTVPRLCRKRFTAQCNKIQVRHGSKGLRLRHSRTARSHSLCRHRTIPYHNTENPGDFLQSPGLLLFYNVHSGST